MGELWCERTKYEGKANLKTIEVPVANLLLVCVARHLERVKTIYEVFNTFPCGKKDCQC